MKLHNPVIFCGSRSSIKHLDKEYALYEVGKGNERGKFEQAQEYLFENIL